MLLGYNTNGFAFHRWAEAIELLAEIGYSSVAITVDHYCLDPYSGESAREVERMRELLDRLDMTSVVETGARYLLNPRVKHEPTLLSTTAGERNRRIDFYERCIDTAVDLGSQAVSFWSGTLREPLADDDAFSRLADGCRRVCDYADRANMRLAFEPEPGMFIERMEQYARLSDLVDAPHFGLTIDVGHVHCLDDGPIPDVLRQWKDRLFNVHIEDMRRDVHEHLPFGEGEIEFPPVIAALAEIGDTGGVHVELSRHSHVAPQVARESFEFLERLVSQANTPGSNRA